MGQASSKQVQFKESVDQFKNFIGDVDYETVGDVDVALTSEVQSFKELEQAFVVNKMLAENLVKRHGVVGALKVVMEKVKKEVFREKFWCIFGLLMAVAIAGVAGFAYVYRKAFVSFLSVMWSYASPSGGWSILIGLTAAGGYAVYDEAQKGGWMLSVHN